MGRARHDDSAVLRRPTDGPAPHRPQAEPLWAPGGLPQAVADHHRLLGGAAGKRQRAAEDRLVRLLPSRAVRAHEMIDAVGEAKPFPVSAHLLVATRERVRHERDGQVVRLAPTERFGGARNERADEVQRHGNSAAQSIDVDVVDADPAVAKPLLVPAVRLLPQLLGGVAPLSGSDARAEKGLVPVALAELAPQRLAHETRDLFRGLPVLHEGVAHVEEDGADGHAGIVSTPPCWTSSSSPSSRSGASARRAGSSSRWMAGAATRSSRFVSAKARASSICAVGTAPARFGSRALRWATG